VALLEREDRLRAGGVRISRVAPTSLALMTAMVKRIEEPELEKRFGEHYVRYRSSVPRFLPRMSLRRRTPKTF